MLCGLLASTEDLIKLLRRLVKIVESSICILYTGLVTENFILVGSISSKGPSCGVLWILHIDLLFASLILPFSRCFII